MERLANAYAPDCERVRQDLSIAEAQLRDYQASIGKPFLHDAYLSELTSLRDQLKTGLSATAYANKDDSGPSVSELAERIKTVKAAHSIEATPQRARQKNSSAEEPVTARIRRRTEAVATSQPGPGLPPESARDSSSKPQPTFQERVAAERQQKDDGPSPT